ncbi:NYN domain-containing protein [Mycena polygramma]|nr:NYN domain-containing protein [Mycena polygramma]
MLLHKYRVSSLVLLTGVSFIASGLGYEVVSGIRNVAHRFGPVKHFKAYMEVADSDTFLRSFTLRSELQSSGVSLTDCPHNGRKNVADQMIMVDMLAYAMDHPAPATLILISGDRDFAYAVSILRLRRYEVVVISLMGHVSLKSQASACLDWNIDVMGGSSSFDGRLNSPTAVRSTFQSPSIRRSNYLPTPEATFSRAPSTSKQGSSATAASPSPPASARTALLTNEPSVARTVPEPAPQVQDEAIRNPAPAYSRPESAPVPSLSSFVPASYNYVGPSTCSTPVQVQNPTIQIPTPASPALFSADHVAAHIQRCMEMGQVQPSASPIPEAGTSTHIDLPPSMSTPRAQNIPTAVERESQGHPAPRTFPPLFKTLIESLNKYRAKGIPRPLRSVIALDIIQNDRKLYERAGVGRFAQYSALAEQAKIITLGGAQASAWISLHPDWC